MGMHARNNMDTESQKLVSAEDGKRFVLMLDGVELDLTRNCDKLGAEDEEDSEKEDK